MVKGSMNPNITALGEQLWPVKKKQNLLVLYKRKIEKQAQRQAAAGRSRHKSHGVIQY